MKKLYIIAGCNGAGKTTAAFNLLPDILNCREFVNADEIARGLSPFQPEKVSFEAGRAMLQRIKSLLKAGESFAIETTLSTRSYVNLVAKAQQEGYIVILLFLWLPSAEMAISRVANRVKEGGHHIPEPVIRRRYVKGLHNFFQLFHELVDSWTFVDNSGVEMVTLAEYEQDREVVYFEDIWEKIKRPANGL